MRFHESSLIKSLMNWYFFLFILIIDIVAGVPEVDRGAAVHRQADRVSWRHAASGRETGRASASDEFLEKVRNNVI